MSDRSANQEQRNRSHIFDSEVSTLNGEACDDLAVVLKGCSLSQPEQPEASRFHKKVGYTVKDEVS